MMLKQSKDSTKNSLRPVTVLAGTVLGMGVIMSPVPEGFSPEAWKVLGVALWMAFWWLTEALPVSVTALLPLIVFPVLGLSDFKTSAAPYAHPLIFLFMGGFMIAKAIEAWNLHKRIALLIVRAFGTRPDYLIAGFMLATATLSMWVSNTATTVMMLPIAISIISVLTDKMDQQTADKTATALLLGVAYSASIGGVGTLVGSPPNALLAAFAQERFGVEVGFAKWMAIGLPVVLIMLPLAWLLLTRVTCPVSRRPIPGADEVIRDELKALGPMTIEEKRVLAIFVLTALSWIFRPLITMAFPGMGLTDSGIALIGALSLFIIPTTKGIGTSLLTWNRAVSLPWGVLLLFGGGLSLAEAISRSGLADIVGRGLVGLEGFPTIVLVVAVATLIVFLTEITSNTATTAVFLPIVATVAVSAGIAPLELIIPVALAASCAFMMPVATPPNAIIFSSEKLTVAQMAKAGFLLNLIAISVIVFITWALVI
ncbi:MAG: DASS family sodium-coupled anion symporter [Alphaproteobacteria bacterium]|jgi:solute carrier family 13 (sodium-dependent dicarboxylate transporter), member 2/3/5|nr:DASS family sodium-coupled anion symporter [Alphaproteobacteria bacterium]MBT4017070.1 DASS family sodium-coupled anion symporter [Alphaproteobacteria bacterium]MBT6386368.1 DASS family sodium-coupled anion symporter [Alphaproteobacteria bacterium]